MMTPFIIEPFVVFFREGVKVFLVSTVIISYIRERGHPEGIRAFGSGLLFSVLLSLAAAVFLLHYGISPKKEIGGFIDYSFALLYLLGLGALYQSHGIDMVGPLKGLKDNRRVVSCLCFVLPFLLFSPEAIGALLLTKELSLMKGRAAITYFSAVLGLVCSLVGGISLMKGAGRIRIGRFFDLPGLVFSIAVIKLMTGGIKGFAEMSLIPSVQRGVMKMFHDIVHQFIVILMVPDHPLLKSTVWNFIGFFIGSTVALGIALMILAVPLAAYLYKTLVAPLPSLSGLRYGAEKRALVADVRSRRRRASLPITISLLLVLASWYAAMGERVSSLSVLQPRPVVSEKGVIVIPLNDPSLDLFDGALHKFALAAGEDTVRILVIKKPGGTLAVCLDACEICPPEGYGQSGEFVVCIFCKTPIPLKAVGEPGGCNPIPLSAVVSERDIRIQEAEILRKWQDVKTGKTRESIK